MKRIGTLVLGILFLLMSQLAFAQGKVHLKESGRSAGSVSAIDLNGITYVDVQATARKLGARVELFATSKQAKITSKGFFAILTGSLDEIIVNGKHVRVSGPIEIRGGKLMAPVEVFLLPSFQQAINKLVEFKDNTLIIERRFNVELAETVLNAKDNLLVFDAQKAFKFTTEQTSPHTALVTLKDVVIKRDAYEKLRTDYISTVEIRQSRNDVQLRVILGEKAKAWSFTQEGAQFVFRAGAVKAAPVLPATTPSITGPVASAITADKPISLVPSVSEEEDENVLSSTAENAGSLTEEAPAEQPLSEEPSAPAVADQDDDEFEEMILGEQGTPATPAPAPAPVATGPVIKAEPHPLAIKAHPKIRIVVDPGHGGKDPGAVRSKYREKDWNLAVGKELTRLLEKGGFEVKITRSTDVFIALSERSRIANNFKADLFVSVHVNSSKDTRANGFQVYFRSEKATDREAAATAALENEAMQYEEVHYNFVDALLQSMAKNEYINESSKLAGYVKNSVYQQPGIGIAIAQKNAIRQANFYVLKGVQSPAILVEMGFISSPKDRAKLAQSSVQKKMAQGIYNGIVNYAKKEGWMK